MSYWTLLPLPFKSMFMLSKLFWFWIYFCFLCKCCLCLDDFIASLASPHLHRTCNDLILHLQLAELSIWVIILPSKTSYQFCWSLFICNHCHGHQVVCFYWKHMSKKTHKACFAISLLGLKMNNINFTSLT